MAFEAVAAEVVAERPELVVFCGDLTWGPLPEETWRLIYELPLPAIFVRGNADRTLAEAEEPSTDRERWLLGKHSPATLHALSEFVESATVDIAGLGPVRFCHGSPRSDEELVTRETPEPRMRALLEGVSERVLVTAHTHMQFDRPRPACARSFLERPAPAEAIAHAEARAFSG